MHIGHKAGSSRCFAMLYCDPMSAHLSIVIPAYNEGVRLGKTLPKVVDYLLENSPEAELIVVDDGSTDEIQQPSHVKLWKVVAPCEPLSLATNRIWERAEQSDLVCWLPVVKWLSFPMRISRHQ